MMIHQKNHDGGNLSPLSRLRLSLLAAIAVIVTTTLRHLRSTCNSLAGGSPSAMDTAICCSTRLLESR